MTRREMLYRFRYAPPLAVIPIHSAREFLAFAATGATPVNSNAGKLTKLPPPATALIAPPNPPRRTKARPVEYPSKSFITNPLDRPAPGRQTPPIFHRGDRTSSWQLPPARMGMGGSRAIPHRKRLFTHSAAAQTGSPKSRT